MILELSDIDLNTADEDGQTPLFWCAHQGDEGVVNWLLEIVNINTNTADKDGQRQLFWAAHNGHEES